MAKNVEIKSEPNLVEAAKRKREDTHIINEDLNIPSELRLVAQGKKFFIRTYGCQANVLDSQNIEGILLEIGYSPVDNPLQADVGTIRADFAQVMQYNVVHASDSIESANREIGLYFKPEEIFDNWQSMSEIIAYDEERYNKQGL